MSIELPSLPASWSRTRLDRVATVNARIGWKALTAAEYQSDGYAFLSTPNIKGREIDFSNVNYISDFRYEESPELQLKPGDVLLAKDGNTLGIVNIVRDLPRPATVNGSIAVIRSTGIDPTYLRHVLASRVTQETINMLKGGMGVPHLFQWDINRLPIPLPPPDEQRRIADFLDAETARINRLIAGREKQSALLDEHYRAATYAAITGANETGPRRASGIAWIDSLPSDWKTMPVNYQFEVMLGKMLNQERTKGDHLRPYLRNTNVQWDRIDTDDLLMMDFPPAEQERYKVLPGDLLVCEGGEPGRAAIWDDGREVYYQKALHRVRARGYSSPRWLYYCLLASTTLNVFATEGNSTTIAHLTGEQLKAHRFPFPDRPIQDKLVGELDALDRRQKKLSLKMIRQAQLLTERRQALITAAVSGQIDVSTASGRGIEE
ncbi:restriction endonuclease subunit S [Streptomyces sp. NPDC020480]|uniref:restriction endonuclease subunit S n=1 Tax=Streptomyces sp. NPDC020480 TaxID=3365076 RepID=UPI0037914A5B